jgi:hypothetical protein
MNKKFTSHNLDKDIKYKNDYSPPMFSHPFRALIAGMSGSGKTTICINLLIDNIMSPFDRVIWVSNPTSLKQQKIINLKNKMKNKLILIEGLDEEEIKKYMEDGYNKGLQQLFVFDDLLNEKNKKIIDELFTNGRHFGCSVAELSQRIFSDDSRTRRVNCDLYMVSNFGDVRECNNLFQMLTTDKNNLHKIADAYRNTVDGKGIGKFFIIDRQSAYSNNPTHKLLKFRNNSLLDCYVHLKDV